MSVVLDSDGLPPNPKYTEIEAFRHPSQHRNEWDCHQAFSKAAAEIAIAPSMSPFVLASVVDQLDDTAYGGFYLSGRLTSAEAAHEAATRINEEIDRTLRENPRLRPLYDELLQRQQRIDSYRAQGKRVPLAWIENPFHRRYYRFKGWAE
jgi:hypothetical protein